MILWKGGTFFEKRFTAGGNRSSLTNPRQKGGHLPSSEAGGSSLSCPSGKGEKKPGIHKENWSLAAREKKGKGTPSLGFSLQEGSGVAGAGVDLRKGKGGHMRLLEQGVDEQLRTKGVARPGKTVTVFTSWIKRRIIDGMEGEQLRVGPEGRGSEPGSQYRIAGPGRKMPL